MSAPILPNGDRALVDRKNLDSSTGGTLPSNPRRPLLERANSSFKRLDDAFALVDDHFSGLTLLDLFVVLEERLDLIGRRLRATSTQLKSKAQESYQGFKSRADEVIAKRTLSLKDLAGLSPEVRAANRRDSPAERVEKEVAKFRARVSRRLERFQQRWNDAAAVSAREKASYMFGVMNICLSSLMLGFRPEWIPISYTAQILFLMPIRIYTYKAKNYHYFLLDNCYFVNVLALIFIWLLPNSTTLFLATYAASVGPLGSAIITWRNSLVFHSLEKVTSLFIHIYPPFVFTSIVHYYPNRTVRFPALAGMETLPVVRTFIVSSVIYLFWQAAYWYFVIVKRKEKIQKLGRVTSFTYLLNDPKGVIGWIASNIKPENREAAFMVCQYLYTIITMQPVFWLYTSSVLSGVYLLILFAVSVYQGSVYYLDIFAHKYEKELYKLKQELETLQHENSSRSSGVSSPLIAATDAEESPIITTASPSKDIPPLSLDGSEESGEMINLSDEGEEVASALRSKSD